MSWAMPPDALRGADPRCRIDPACSLMRSPTIVLHDKFAFRGGGERLALAAARGLHADLAFGSWSAASYPLDGLSGRTIDLSVRLPVPVIRVLALSRAFRRFGRQLGAYESRIYSGNCAPLAVLTAPAGGRNVFYCHTPPRYIYESAEYYRGRGPMPARSLASAVQRILKPAYEDAVRRMDVVVANSRFVQARIRRYLDVESVVVYPPCETDRFRWTRPGEYYLSMARLDPLKRIDRIIRAFRRMPTRRLVVTSSGPEAQRLRAIAKGASNISFTGAVSDAELAALLGAAVATIYVPEGEDFGMSPVESMAAGKPVIGVAEGGVPESVLHEVTGLLLAADPGVEDIVAAVQMLDVDRALAMREACEARASEFAGQRFTDALEQILDRRE